jgi:hypothetical protein
MDISNLYFTKDLYPWFYQLKISRKSYKKKQQQKDTTSLKRELGSNMCGPLYVIVFLTDNTIKI